MQGLAIGLVLLLIPLLLVIFLRTNAALLFFVITAASTLQTYLDKDVTGFASAIIPGRDSHVVPIVLLVVPFAAAAFAFRRTVTPKMLPIHLLLALLVGLSAAFMSSQFLPQSVAISIKTSQYYGYVQPYSSVVIAGAFLLSVVLLWLSHPKHLPAHKHGH